jgi:hypothetical protein
LVYGIALIAEQLTVKLQPDNGGDVRFVSIILIKGKKQLSVTDIYSYLGFPNVDGFRLFGRQQELKGSLSPITLIREPTFIIRYPAPSPRCQYSFQGKKWNSDAVETQILEISDSERVIDTKWRLLNALAERNALPSVLRFSFWKVELFDNDDILSYRIPNRSTIDFQIRDTGVIEANFKEGLRVRYTVNSTVEELAKLMTLRENMKSAPVQAAPPPAATPQTYLICLQLGIVPVFARFSFLPSTLLHDTVEQLKKKWPDLNGLHTEFVMLDGERNYILISPQTPIGDLDHSQNSLVIREVEIWLRFKIDQRGQDVRLGFPEHTTIAEVRVKVAERLKVDPGAVKLLFAGNELRDKFMIDRVRISDEIITVEITD